MSKVPFGFLFRTALVIVLIYMSLTNGVYWGTVAVLAILLFYIELAVFYIHKVAEQQASIMKYLIDTAKKKRDSDG